MNEQEIRELQENGYEEWLDSRSFDEGSEEGAMKVSYTKKQGWIIEADEIVLAAEFNTREDALNFLLDNADALHALACRYESIICGDL